MGSVFIIIFIYAKSRLINKVRYAC